MTNSAQDIIESLREDNKRQLEEYHEKLRSFSKMRLGNSIVRDSSIHDRATFTIEQDISLYVTALAMHGLVGACLLHLDYGHQLNKKVSAKIKCYF